MTKLPEGFRQLDDFEIATLLRTYPRDKTLRLLIGDYQRLRNIETLNVRQRTEGETVIESMMPRTEHLAISDKIIVACNEIQSLRAELEVAHGEAKRYIRLWCNANELIEKKNARISVLTWAFWLMMILSLISAGVILWLSRCVQAAAAGS